MWYRPFKRRKRRDISPVSAWFAGPKGENSTFFSRTIRQIMADHLFWRRNYFPEDGVVITSEVRRRHAHWEDLFEDKLIELLAALKADYPFHSPRYAAHMLAEQTLPGIAGYFAGMLYNPNNVSKEAAPVTVRLELEAARLIAEMLGYDGAQSWGHLTSGGTIANLEALWAARSVKYLPFVLRDVSKRLEFEHPLREQSNDVLLGIPPQKALQHLVELFDAAQKQGDDRLDMTRRVIEAFRTSEMNVMHSGLPRLLRTLESEPVLLVPETHHYSLPKSIDVLGFGQQALVSVGVDRRFRMDVDDLRDKLDAAEAENRHVLAVVAVAGSTEEGAVDPIDRIVALRASREAEGQPSFWLHVDAAYGGYFRTAMLPEPARPRETKKTIQIGGRSTTLTLPATLSEDTHRALAALGQCDSIVVDPHKLGYVPYPAGAVCFKSDLIRPVLRQHAPYLEDFPQGPREEKASPNIGVYILEGSKPGASAASVWLSHTTIPLDRTGLGKLIEETAQNARELAALLERWPMLTGPQNMQAVSLCPPELNIVCYAFRASTASMPLVRLNELNRALYRYFSIPEDRRKHVYDQRFFVSRTVLSAPRYRYDTIAPFLERMGVTRDEYLDHGVFLLRSTLMNPWYAEARRQGHHYLAALVDELYRQAGRLRDGMAR